MNPELKKFIKELQFLLDGMEKGIEVNKGQLTERAEGYMQAVKDVRQHMYFQSLYLSDDTDTPVEETSEQGL